MPRGRPKKIYTNEKTITNIDQQKGVSAEQLLSFCESHLITKIEGSHLLSSDDKLSACYDAVASILNKMNQGIVPKYDYQEFKGYLFITLKNFVLHTYQRNASHSSKTVSGNLTPDDLFDDTRTTSNASMVQYKSLLSQFTDLERQIISWLQDGYKQKDIGNILGISKTTCCNMMISLRKKASILFDVKMPPTKVYAITPEQKEQKRLEYERKKQKEL